jgi:hypothetical protein
MNLYIIVMQHITLNVKQLVISYCITSFDFQILIYNVFMIIWRYSIALEFTIHEFDFALR